MLALLERLSGSVELIDTEALGEKGVVAAYLVQGKENALIDTGYRSSADVIIRDLEARGIERLDYLLPTHVHLDHCGACGTLATRYPSATVLVHPRGLAHVQDPKLLVRGASGLFGTELMRRYGSPDPVTPKRSRAIADDETIQLGRGFALRCIWTPGHASHHLSYLLEADGTLFTGDAIGVRHPAFPVLIPTTPPTSFNLEKAIETLDRLSALPLERLLTPHFGALEKARERVRENRESLRAWNTRLSEYFARGLDVDQIAETVLKDVCAQINRSITDVPEYLRTMTRVSVLGFAGYLKWKSNR